MTSIFCICMNVMISVLLSYLIVLYKYLAFFLISSPLPVRYVQEVDRRLSKGDRDHFLPVRAGRGALVKVRLAYLFSALSIVFFSNVNEASRNCSCVFISAFDVPGYLVGEQVGEIACRENSRHRQKESNF